MIIKSLSGKSILSTKYKTMRAALEYALDRKVDLSGGDFRKARLRGASLDGLIARGSSFWGADLSGADIGFACLEGADFRACDLSDTCFAQSNLTDADMKGASFSGTIFDGAILTGIQVSCPSFWGCRIQEARFQSISYIHKGESEVHIDRVPLMISGPLKNLVIFDRHILWGADLYAENAPAA